jgi:hypothetical protein
VLELADKELVLELRPSPRENEAGQPGALDHDRLFLA